ncbi:MAG: tRNA (cytidine(34)-2'-O)-methyltransferase [Deltaproteobacteria bacterium]|nr:tRNA (cytidine(34)-2'-O)-methyltransferase [Deltaproteobacteria bacterium]
MQAEGVLTDNIERHVVLVAPDVHWNTGNIGRTCLGTNASLHLIKPLGFSLDSRQVKRAGLDYWSDVKLSVWDDFKAFSRALCPLPEQVFLYTKTGGSAFWKVPDSKRMFLIFGSESKGLPRQIRDAYRDNTYHIPITRQIRSLNLSTAVGIALYETLRTARPFHAYM